MNKLEELLKINNSSRERLPKAFQEIARSLMCNYLIKKGQKTYAIVEIEFYLYNNEHKDFITYPRHIKEAGRWFFHQSGVDLSFRSENVNIRKGDTTNSCTITENSIFGGILIRGIYDISSKQYIFGPLKCVNILWDHFDAFGESEGEYPVLEIASGLPVNLYRCKRFISIRGVEKQKIKIKDWTARLGIELNDSELECYREELFDLPERMCYRFFNLQNGERPWDFTKIPKAIRPPKEETKRLEQSLPI